MAKSENSVIENTVLTCACVVFLPVELMRLVGDGNTFSKSVHDDRSAVFALKGM